MARADVDAAAPARVQRVLRAAAVVAVLALLAVAAVVAWLWSTTHLPPAASVVPPQQSVVRFSDGTEIARVGDEDRRPVRLEQVSVAARHAVLAAEDRDFYDSPGISLSGIARAAWANLRSGQVEQGGSTITQQYARAAFLSSERTWGRKLREAVLAVKLDRTRDKDAVLTDYLNTVYFGRGAYGIESAALTWFGKPAAELTASEGAVLASLLRSPTAYDPERSPERARARWRYVLDGMAERGWLEGAAQAEQYPVVAPRESSDRLGGTNGYLVRQALDELRELGFSEASVEAGGLVVETTFDPRAQAEAVRSVQTTVPALPDGVYAALVAVEPGTGRVRALYGGDDYLRRPFDAAVQGAAQAGSAFKPYVLAAALDRGIPLTAELDGSSPRTFDDYRVRNFAGASYGTVDVATATAKSVNTAYVELGLRVGPRHVARMAEELGITADMSVERESAAISLGVTTVTPLEQASAFATLAAGGVRADPYVVERVTDAEGRVHYEAAPQPHRVLDEAVAADVTSALRGVLTSGTAVRARLPGRPAAGKTGTTSGNTAAWFVGYTPQLSTAVAVFSERQDVPLRGFAGVREVTGGTLPARTWRTFMTAALDGVPVAAFPPPAGVGPPPPPEPLPTPSISPLPPRQDDGPRDVVAPPPGAPLDLDETA